MIDPAEQSAARFLLDRYESRQCDSSGVADCERCNIVFLAKRAGGLSVDNTYRTCLECGHRWTREALIDADAEFRGERIAPEQIWHCPICVHDF